MFKYNDLSDFKYYNNGFQKKYIKDNFFYKLDESDNTSEAITEELVTKLLNFSSLNKNDFASYEYGILGDKYASRSKNFLKNDSELINFNTLSKEKQKFPLDYFVDKFHSVNKGVDYTIDFISKNFNVDIKNYLKNCITLDYIIKNTDRDFSNLALVKENNVYKVSPIFDNANGLMSCENFNRYKSIEDNLKDLSYKPFSHDINEMYNYFGPGFKVDFNAFLNFLNENYNIKEGEYGFIQLQILKYQCERLKNTELDVNLKLEDKIESLINEAEKPFYEIKGGKIILNNAAKKECDELLKNGVIKDIRQYPAFKDSQNFNR